MVRRPRVPAGPADSNCGYPFRNAWGGVGGREAIEGRRDGPLVSLGIRQDGRKLAVDPAGIRLPEADHAFSARTDSMNRSAIQPEPRMPQRTGGASWAGAIREGGNELGKGIERATG